MGLREKCDSGAVRPSSYSGEGRTARCSHFSRRTTRALGAPIPLPAVSLHSSSRSPPTAEPRRVRGTHAQNLAGHVAGWVGERGRPVRARQGRHTRRTGPACDFRGQQSRYSQPAHGAKAGAESAGGPWRKVRQRGGSTLSRVRRRSNRPVQSLFSKPHPRARRPNLAPRPILHVGKRRLNGARARRFNDARPYKSVRAAWMVVDD